jgi:hypothetical protein
MIFTNWGNLWGKLAQENWKLLSQNRHQCYKTFSSSSSNNKLECLDSFIMGSPILVGKARSLPYKGPHEYD